MRVHVQLADLMSGVLVCLAHLFGGLFRSDPEWFWCGSYFDGQMHHSGDGDLLEVLEWAMLAVVLHVHHSQPQTVAA